MTFSELRRNLKRYFSGFPVQRLALLGDSSIQLLAQGIREIRHEYSVGAKVHDVLFSI